MIVGDANMSEVATYLKVGTTALWFAMVEDDQVPRRRSASPDRCPSMRQVSRDLTLTETIELTDGRTVDGARDPVGDPRRMCREYAEREGLEAVGADVGSRDPRPLGARAGRARVRSDVVGGHRRLGGQVPAHRRLPRPSRPRVERPDGCRAMDLQYHDLRPERVPGPTRRAARRSSTPAMPTWRSTEPPDDTRAWFRGRCLQRFASEIVAANWDSMVFDVGRSVAAAVPMMEPCRGTKAHVGDLLEQADSAADLIRLLSA